MRAKVVVDDQRHTWAVKYGVSFIYFGTLYACEEYCRMRGITITNEADINRVKYNNMPVVEMLSQEEEIRHIQPPP